MKKILSIIFLLSAFATFTASAQYSAPRYGTAPTQDNTGRVITYGKVQRADTAGTTTDTLLTSLQDGSGRSFYHTDITVTLADSAVIAFRSLTGFHYGDNLTFYISNTAGTNHYLNFLGYSGQTSGWAMATTGTKISPASGGWAILGFWFDGVLWREQYRDVH